MGNKTNSWFVYGGIGMEAQDLGNFHYGAVGSATGLFSEWLMLSQAGKRQIIDNNSRPEWQNGWKTSITPPYGDDPRDQMWIKQGFKHYKYKK